MAIPDRLQQHGRTLHVVEEMVKTDGMDLLVGRGTQVSEKAWQVLLDWVSRMEELKVLREWVEAEMEREGIVT